MISGTLAKYVTNGSGSDTARVARWGVTAPNIVSNLFEHSNNAIAGPDTVPGEPPTSMYLLAPGANGGRAFTVDLGGIPEVAYTVTIDTTGTQYNGTWASYPIQFRLNNNDDPLEAEEGWGTLAQLEAALKLELSGDASGISRPYHPNEAFEILGGDEQAVEFTIEWRWPFFVNGAGDIADTILGNTAGLSVTVVVNIIVAQSATLT
jgi:hypothetical protein